MARRLLGTDRPAPVRGRDPALTQIEAFVARGRGVFLIAGEGGVGKTRLAVEVVRRAAAAGAAALVGLGYDFEGTAPYTPFVDAWSDYLRIARRSASANPFLSFRPVPGASAQEDRLRLFQSVEHSLEELSGDRGACILLEDLHQADESSLFLFHHLARAARHLPLMLVGTLREEEAEVGKPLHTLLAGLGRERLAEKLYLPRLDRSATAELVRDLGFEVAEGEALEAVYRLAEGNPYYTEEVMRTMRERGLEEPAPSDDLLEGVRQRVARLGPEAERLFAAAAVFGQHFDFEVVKKAAALEPGDSLPALEDGLRLRIVEEHEARYRFRHALTRQALYGALTHARRVHLHREVAAALEAQRDAELEGNAELLAFHYQEAGEIARALPHLLNAAQRAQARLGFGEGVHFYEQAIEVMDALGKPPDRERFDALRSMGGMRVALGDLDRAVADLEGAASLRGPGDWRPGRRERAGVLRLAGLALIEAGELDAAEERLDRAWELSLGEGGLELSNVLYLYSQLRWHQSRHRDAYQLAEQCLTEAEKHDDRQAIARGYEMLALACHSLGEWREGTEYEERRQSLADGTLDVASAFDVHH